MPGYKLLLLYAHVNVRSRNLGMDLGRYYNTNGSREEISTIEGKNKRKNKKPKIIGNLKVIILEGKVISNNINDNGHILRMNKAKEGLECESKRKMPKREIGIMMRTRS